MAIAMYLRLSESDGDLGVDGKDESNSIENQRELLYSFLNAREDLTGEVIEYIDDGYSGTNFDRPGFKKMIEDAKKGIVNTVVVKDLSRLGRDYIVAGDYIEQIFPMLNVRFIAANNGYDSIKHSGGASGFDVAINNLVNTFYSRDLSKKLKAANKVRWKQGISTAGHAPFGYIKSLTEKGKYVIDPEASTIVRFVFEKAMAGNTAKEIACLLNDRKYPTPLVYQKTRHAWNLAEPVTAETERLWDCSKVLDVLKRVEYTGTLVMGRKRSMSVGARSTKPRPENEWIVVEGVNEPIVSKEEYEKANLVIRQAKKPDYFISQNYPLKGKVRCGNCRQCLTYTVTTYKEHFICRHGRQVSKHSNCCKDEYPVKQIEELVWRTLVKMMKTLSELGSRVEAKTKEQLQTAKKTKSNTENEINTLKAEKIRQYELYADGIISKERYLAKRQELCNLIDGLENNLSQLSEEMSGQKELMEKATESEKDVKKFSDTRRLTKQIVKAFIQAIYVYDLNHIEIVFIHEDVLKQFESYLTEIQMNTDQVVQR